MSGTSGTEDVAQEQISSVRSALDDALIDAAAEHDIDVDGVVETVVDENPKYQARTQAKLAKTAIESQIESAQASTLRGIAMGSRDRHGRNWPRRISLIQPDGDHKEVGHWDGTLPGPSGTDERIPHGSVAEFACDYESDYDSYQARRIVETEDIGPGELRDRLLEVAKRPGEISRSDQYDVVVVAGDIAYVNPQTVFAGGEPDGDGPVVVTDERGDYQPHFEVSLVDDNGVRVRAHLERQAYGEPYVNMPDLPVLLEDAMDRPSPAEQASLLESVYQDDRVIVVGNVNKVDSGRDRDGNERTYVDIAVTGLLNVDVVADESGDVVTTADDAPRVTDDAYADDEPADGDSDGDGEPSSADPDALRESIAKYADATGEPLDNLDPETLADALSMDVTPSEVSAAITAIAEDATDAVDAGDAVAMDGSDDEGDDDPLESLVGPDGAYQCPVQTCPTANSDRAAIAGHIQGEHGGDPFDADWLRRAREGDL